MAGHSASIPACQGYGHAGHRPRRRVQPGGGAGNKVVIGFTERVWGYEPAFRVEKQREHGSVV